MKIITRKEAKEQGLTRYFTGLPCPHGHISERVVSTYACLDCHRKRTGEYFKTGYAEENRRRAKEWRDANLDRARAGDRSYAKNNRGKRNAIRAKYRASVLQRTPVWADTAGIRRFYEACPFGMHVDHIIPLQGKLVSGLHVLNNLCYLPGAENSSKGNKFDPDAWE